MADQPSFPLVANLDAAKAAIAQEIGTVVQGFGPEEVALLLSRVQAYSDLTEILYQSE